LPGATPSLKIANGSTLDAVFGVTINNGNVTLVGNPNIPDNPNSVNHGQVATIKGTFTLNDGVIGFYGTPTTVATATGNILVWGEFMVDGEAVWNGGVYNPGLNGQSIGGGSANLWHVTGTLTVNLNGPSQPSVIPVFQNLPAGQTWQRGQWNVIRSDTQLAGGDPLVPQGWGLVSRSQNNMKKWWDVSYGGPGN